MLVAAWSHYKGKYEINSMEFYAVQILNKRGRASVWYVLAIRLDGQCRTVPICMASGDKVGW